MTAAMIGGVVFFVQYLQASLGEGPLAAGVRLLPLTATLFVVAPISGRFVARLGERPIVVMAGWRQAAGLVWMALQYRRVLPGADPRHGADRRRGVRRDASRAKCRHLRVRREAIGTASGVYNAMRQVGGAFGIAIVSAVFTAAGGFASPAAVGHGVRAALLVTAAISASGALAGVGLRATPVAGLPASAPRITAETATPRALG